MEKIKTHTVEKTEMGKLFLTIFLFLASFVFAVSPSSNPTTKPSTPSSFIVYNGKPRTEAWFNRMWEEIGKDTVEIGGKIANLNELISQDRLYVIRGEILQILGENECLITSKSSDDIARVLGFYVHGATDGDFLKISAVRCGTYQYKSVAGSVKTIKNYVVPTSVTKQKFKKEIENGLNLNRWRKIKVVPNRKKADWQVGLIVEEKTIDTPNGPKTFIYYSRMKAYPIK